jgi:uncharacterized phage infection (PIP) family protein YhgE
MSFVNIIGVMALLALSCLGVWKGALYWNNRTRDALDEDPRDQEIREIEAALSIVRKQLASTNSEKEAHSAESIELGAKLSHTNASLTNIQQKFNATKDHLNKEIDQRNELADELTQTIRDLEKSRNLVQELELQIGAPVDGSSMIDDHDLLSDGAEALLQAREKAEQLAGEVEKWKRHCAAMNKTNKTLRAQVDELTGVCQATD